MMYVSVTLTRHKVLQKESTNLLFRFLQYLALFSRGKEPDFPIPYPALTFRKYRRSIDQADRFFPLA